MVSFLIFLPIRGVALPILMGLGKPGRPAVALLVMGLLNLGLSIALIGPLGLVGVALGTAVPNVLFAGFPCRHRRLCPDRPVGSRASNTRRERRRMSLYENVFVVRQDVSAQQVEELTERYSAIITEGGGQVTKNEYWGLKTLAYRIKKNRKGHYVLLNLDAPSSAVQEMERNMRLNEDIIRLMTIRVDELEEGPSAMMRNRGQRDDRGRGGRDRDRDRERRPRPVAPAADGEAKSEAKPETKTEAKPEAKTEAKPEAKPETKTEAKPEATPEAKTEAKPEATPDKTEGAAETAAEPKATPAEGEST